MLQIPGLYLQHTEKKGRGVFCSDLIEANSLIEICPVILLNEADLQFIDKTRLYEYYFEWPDEMAAACICLGLGSMYNHDKEANAEVVFDLEAKEIIIQSKLVINAGDEICIDYMNDGKGGKPYWFEPAK